MSRGVSAKLFLLPTCLGDTPLSAVLPADYSDRIKHLRAFFVEDLRSARRFLRKAGFRTPFEEVIFVELNEHTREGCLEEVLEKAGVSEEDLLNQDMGVLSEAGMPCVADPGALAVSWAHRKGLRVVPVCGPSSIFLALAASGLNGQNFCFHGYLPVAGGERAERLKQLETAARKNRQTQIFIETPYRSQAMFEAVLNTCRPDTKFCVASLITCEGEFIRTLTTAEWKAACGAGNKPDINKKNTVFLIG